MTERPDPLLAEVHDALARVTPSTDATAILAQIGGRSPAQMADVSRARGLRAATVAAAVVLVGLLFAARIHAPLPSQSPVAAITAPLSTTSPSASPPSASPLMRLAAPSLAAAEEEDDLTSEVALLSAVVFGGIR